MSEHDQRHQRREEEHEHERAEKKHHDREHDRPAGDPKPLVHPAWLFVVGVILMLGVVLVWTLF